MFRRIFKAASFAIASMFLASLIFFGALTSANALSQEANGNNPLKIVIEPSESNQASEENFSMNQQNVGGYPDLGDDQVFPFVAGLDSYESLK